MIRAIVAGMTADELLDQYAVAYKDENGHLPLIMMQDVYTFYREQVRIVETSIYDKVENAKVCIENSAMERINTTFNRLAWRETHMDVQASVPCLSEDVRKHHEEQFGKVDWSRLAAKLGEECGELQGAIVRNEDQRDGRLWLNEMCLELQDVLTVLHVMADRMSVDLIEAAAEAGRYFLTRRFDNITKQTSTPTAGN